MDQFIGTVEFVGCTEVWGIFEHAHLRPLVMPAVGLPILVPLVGRQGRVAG